MFNDKRLTGIGKLEFLGANQMILTDEYAGLCVMYQAIHGEEDKKKCVKDVLKLLFPDYSIMFSP